MNRASARPDPELEARLRQFLRGAEPARPDLADHHAWALGPIHAFQRVSSTMEIAHTLAESGAPEGTLVWAARQDQGRGRLGRTWASPEGGAYLSLILRPARPPAEIPQLSLVAGLAAAEAIRELTDLVPMIRWPNDLLIEGRKVAGILVEARTHPNTSREPRCERQAAGSEERRRPSTQRARHSAAASMAAAPMAYPRGTARRGDDQGRVPAKGGWPQEVPEHECATADGDGCLPPQPGGPGTGAAAGGVGVGSRSRAVIVGIGINVRTSGKNLPETATSLAAAGAAACDPYRLTGVLCRRCQSWYAVWSAEGFSPIREALRPWMGLFGHPVRIAAGTERCEGTASDLDASGRLLVRLDSGILRECEMGEVTSQPAP